VPQDLIYLAQARARFSRWRFRGPGRGILAIRAVARKRIWIEADLVVDERMDPDKATRAARQHLRDLTGFSGLYLAIARILRAGNVQKGVERAGYADFGSCIEKCAAAGDEELCADHPSFD